MVLTAPQNGIFQWYKQVRALNYLNLPGFESPEGLVLKFLQQCNLTGMIQVVLNHSVNHKII